jgi:PAS domain-containing protein
MEGAQKPLELILARNLLTSLSTPAFLVDNDGGLLFYNEAAGALLGVSFEEVGRMTAEDWSSSFGPFDERGEPIPIDELPVTAALRDRRPHHSTFLIRSTKGEQHVIEASALPIVGTDSPSSGAMIFFWPAATGAERGAVTEAARAAGD